MKSKGTKYINSELDLQEVKNYIDFLKLSGSEFSVIMSNYTTTIKSKYIKHLPALSGAAEIFYIIILKQLIDSYFFHKNRGVFMLMLIEN